MSDFVIFFIKYIYNYIYIRDLSLMYIADCRHADSACPMITFADDSDKLMIGKINNDNDSVYIEEINSSVKWCHKKCVLTFGNAELEVILHLFVYKGKRLKE